MNIIIDTKELQEVVKKMDYVIDNKSKVGILKDIKIVADKKVTMVATNLITTLEIDLKNASIKENGECLLTNVPGIKKSFKFFKNVDTIVNKDGDHVSVTNDKKSIKNITEDSNDFPTLPELSIESSYEYNTQKLANRISKARIMIEKLNNGNSPRLDGINFNKNDIVGVDGYRLSVTKDDNLNVKRSFTICRDMADVFKKLINKKDNHGIIISIDYEKKYVVFEYDNIRLTSKILEYDYVNYEQVIPQDYDTKINVNTKELKDTVDFLSTHGDVLITNITNKSFNLSINNKTGVYDSSVNVENYNGFELDRLGINPKYLLDALNCIDNDKIEISVRRVIDPVVIRDIENKELYLILPLRLAG